MINVGELEQRWIKYKIKQYIPFGGIALIIILVLIIYSFIDFDKPAKQDKTKQPPKIAAKTQQKPLHVAQNDIKPDNSQVVKQKAQNIQIPSKTNTIKTKKEKVVLEPSLDFIKHMRGNNPLEYRSVPIYNKPKPKPKPKLKPKPKPKPKNIEANQEIIIQPQEVKPTIIIKREDTKKDIETVIKRFKTNQNPALSLFAAKKYYEIGEYKKAYDYALITNNINSDIEASWLVFAKSLVKLGEKDKAIKVLQQYYKHSGSQNAKMLLNKIITGKFQ